MFLFFREYDLSRVIHPEYHITLKISIIRGTRDLNSFLQKESRSVFDVM